MDIHVSPLKKVDLILTYKEIPSWPAFITKQLAHGFEQLGIQARLLVSPKNKDPRPFLEDLYSHSPDCTICFNGILPDSEGHFLADLVQIPHFAILTESPNNFLTLAKSKYTTTLSPDQQYLDILKEGGCARTLFFPLAAPNESGAVATLKERKNSILMAPIWLDSDTVRDFWKQNLPKKMVEFLEEVVNRCLESASVSYYHAFQIVLGEKTAEEQQVILPWTTFALFDQIETVLRQTDMVELIKAFEGTDIQLVVEQDTLGKWQKKLGALANRIKFHEGLSAEDTLYMLKQSKIFLASSPQFKFGTMGDLYTSLSTGAYTFHSPSDFLQLGYGQGKGVYFYPFRGKEAIVAKAKDVLNKPENYQDEVNVGRKQVLESETWLSRAKQLADYIPGVLAQYPKKKETSPG